MNRGPIYLIGSSGNPNFGDEFITASWLRFLAVERPEAEIWLDCPHPGTAQTLFAGLHPRLHITDTLWRCAFENRELKGPALKARMESLVENLGSPAYDLGLLKLRQMGSLHLIGGGYINGMWANHSALVYAVRAVRRLTGADLFATGLGLMPAVGDELVNQDLFADFNHATARDHASAQAYGIAQAPDDAFLGVKDELERNPRDGVFVCIQSDTAEPALVDSAVSAARELLQPMADAGRTLHYVEAVPGADRVAYEQLADIIPEENFLPFTELWRSGLPLSRRQTWITTRFHFHLLAAAAGADGVALPVNPGYYDVKHQSLLDLGSGWATTASDSPANRASGAGTLSDNLGELSALKESEAKQLYGQKKVTDLARARPLARLSRSAGRSFNARLRK